jgi:hypothetical protein
MSAHPHEWLVAEGRVEEGTETLSKPFGRETLLTAVRRALQNHEPEPSERR